MGAAMGGKGWGMLAESRGAYMRCCMCGQTGRWFVRRLKCHDPQYWYCVYCCADWDFPLACHQVDAVVKSRIPGTARWKTTVKRYAENARRRKRRAERRELARLLAKYGKEAE
jgi:hypothetical protein